MKENFGHVDVFCYQSGIKEQEEIIILAQNFCGRCMQRVLIPLNPHNLLETALKNHGTGSDLSRKMCRHALGWTGLKPACYKPRKSSFCFEQTAQTLIYFFHFLS